MVMVRFDRCGWGREGQERQEMEAVLINCAQLSPGRDLGWGNCVLSICRRCRREVLGTMSCCNHPARTKHCRDLCLL